MSLLLIKFEFRYTKHLKMIICERFSCSWQTNFPEMVVKWSFMSHKFPGLFLQNCKKLEVKEYVYFVAAFDPN